MKFHNLDWLDESSRILYDPIYLTCVFDFWLFVISDLILFLVFIIFIVSGYAIECDSKNPRNAWKEVF